MPSESFCYLGIPCCSTVTDWQWKAKKLLAVLLRSMVEWPFILQECCRQIVHIHSRRFYIAPLQVHYYSEVLPTTAFCQSYLAEGLQATTSEGLAQGPSVVARVGFWTRCTEPTAEPPCPTYVLLNPNTLRSLSGACIICLTVLHCVTI